MTVPTRAALDAVDVVVRDVEDPELPHVTIGDLGIVRSVSIDGEVVTVELTPTYTGCPATEQIRDDVAAAVRAAGFRPVIEMAMSPAWTTDWISPRGRERLHAAGITPPPCVADAPSPTPAVTVSITPRISPPISPLPRHARCPRCDSSDTRLVTEFGATACKASYVCRDCHEPFEAFKAI